MVLAPFLKVSGRVPTTLRVARVIEEESDSQRPEGISLNGRIIHVHGLVLSKK